MPSERDRTRLIAELASLLHDCQLTEDARCASLTLIGWLARRMPGEAASTDGVEHARRQLEGLGMPCGMATAGLKTAIKTTAVRVESRSIVVRTRRGRTNDVPAIGSQPVGAPASGSRRPVLVADAMPPTEAGRAASAPIPRPNGKKQPSA